jgi:hypothetical protein
MQVSVRSKNGRRCKEVAKRNVRIRAVRREKVDIDMLVSGLLLLLEELAADTNDNGDGNTTDHGETDR